MYEFILLGEDAVLDPFYVWVSTFQPGISKGRCM